MNYYYYYDLISSIISNVDSGGVCVNDTLMHAVGHLPFGGIGPSGMGAYHGKKLICSHCIFFVFVLLFLINFFC